MGCRTWETHLQLELTQILFLIALVLLTRSVELSIDAVASSNTNIILLLKRARPKQNKCRCPMLQFGPSSTTRKGGLRSICDHCKCLTQEEGSGHCIHEGLQLPSLSGSILYAVFDRIINNMCQVFLSCFILLHDEIWNVVKQSHAFKYFYLGIKLLLVYKDV